MKSREQKGAETCRYTVCHELLEMQETMQEGYQYPQQQDAEHKFLIDPGSQRDQNLRRSTQGKRLSQQEAGHSADQCPEYHRVYQTLGQHPSQDPETNRTEAWFPSHDAEQEQRQDHRGAKAEEAVNAHIG